jgi:hypothetical protein
MSSAARQKVEAHLERGGASHHFSPSSPDGVKVPLHVAIALSILLQANLIGRQPAVDSFRLKDHSLRRRTGAEAIKQVDDLAHKRAHSSHWRWTQFELSARLKGHIPFGLHPPREGHNLLEFINGDWLWVAACEAHGEEL